MRNLGRNFAYSPIPTPNEKYIEEIILDPRGAWGASPPGGSPPRKLTKSCGVVVGNKVCKLCEFHSIWIMLTWFPRGSDFPSCGNNQCICLTEVGIARIPIRVSYTLHKTYTLPICTDIPLIGTYNHLYALIYNL